MQSLIQAEEQHLVSLSSKVVSKMSKAMSKTSIKKAESATTSEHKLQHEIVKDQLEEVKQNIIDEERLKKFSKKKTKPKKSKKGETENQNISVKSSFSKFDALQNRNLIHNPQGEMQKNCHVCDKAVYKMEEIKAETNIYHKNCFRCSECAKQLKVDTYFSYEGKLYCNVHFKLIFAPKSVEDDDTVKPRKPELIIRENQPIELPPDVIRSSDKPDLGLEELQKLNVRSKFQVFEQGDTNSNKPQQEPIRNNNVVRRSESLLSRVAKLQELGNSSNSQQDSCISSDNDDDSVDFDSSSENPNADLIRQKKHKHKQERPVGIGEAMNDIRSMFEKGHRLRKEERREERKQEIQNIRSRLFMGKQARIKEMYQQAVAESEHGNTANDKKSDIEIEVDSKSLRDRFEKGEVFRENQSGNENDGKCCRKGTIENEADVFECGISRQSRSIFMELDANAVNGINPNIIPTKSGNKGLQHQKSSNSIGGQSKLSELDNNIVKCGEEVEDVKIETSEISEKFKFFEKYNPTENKRKIFRMTPPRDGVVKMPTPEEEENDCENEKDLSPDRNVIAHSRTTSIMLNKFRELEKNTNRSANNSPKPLKCFTPPPDGNRRLYVEQDSDEYDSNEDDDDEDIEDEEDDNNNNLHLAKDDEALIEAQNAARAKQLRIKFEKWQVNEINREKNEEINHNIYGNNEADENSIESTQSIRERFEKMRNIEKPSQPTRPRYQVNRFV